MKDVKKRNCGRNVRKSEHQRYIEEGIGENLSGICPYILGSVLNSWTTEEIPVIFKTNSESPDINDTSDAVTGSESPFEQDMCLEEPRDFEDDRDCNLSPDLLRIVEQDEKQILPYKESVEIVSLGDKQEKKEVKIGACITAETKRDLIELLQEFKDVFTWSFQDMSGLSTDIMVHWLPIKEECKLVQQKLRRMRSDVLLKIKEEVKKQFDAGFLQVLKYSEWVANIVLIPKKDGKVRICVDYKDLNEASPKDNFPLPHIDTLVDNIAGYSLFSFMDGFSYYNQIKMHPKDMEKTTFVTMWGIFFYKVMLFGLKNAVVTYQKAMVTLFHDMMLKDIEVYVDDIIAKSRIKKKHVQVLRKLFLRLRKFQLKLNPAKCTFGARLGKLLRFIGNEKRIEIDPDKVKAKQDLPLPCTQKEVRGFLGRLNYIARFISQLTKKCNLIFRLIKKHNPGVWDEECQKTFYKVKHYLSNALVPMSPIFGNSTGCVLGQHDESRKKERVIYYLSKKITECETRYSPIEKLCCALIWTTQRLRQYMLYHATWLI
ncbi:RNA-directed DNA polymerase (Reverse transcriptase), Ribonuclease H-like protein [Gossypium australe]|uniref:RNA-directed DNA polymerase (Reverse transcriptase), Ribonuclease H-like protein n=1 Tax=Gossypium australe TaxID=47621 RepID=A0A5B6WX92_9ROSI|nr:RNA-directed DNA polymerase (Reverse transcriptase), Ribonuclease H-like protein [Gossypium australe]